MKTLKDMFEVYRPKSPDEQKFVDKHVTIKHKDRNEVNGKANGDDVFKATNIKTGDREATRHGYDVGADEKVYEENEFYVEENMIDEGIIDDLFHKPKKEVRTYKYSYGKTTDLPDGEKPFQKATNPKAKNNPVPRDENGDTLYQKVQKSRGMKEDVEKIDEGNAENKTKKNVHAGKVGQKLARERGSAFYSDAKKAGREILRKEDIINRAIEKYMPEVADIKPLTMEQRLAKKLDGLSEGHMALLFSLFTNLNEDNQLKMIDTCEDIEGINQLIDFALENNRGE